MPRFDPRIHKLCEVPDCHRMEVLIRVQPYNILKRICERCYRKAQILALERKPTFFLLNKTERAEVSAQEMIDDEVGDPEECVGCGETNCGDRCIH